MIGLLTIPWTMTAELFPNEIRGVAHSISYSMANILMFFAIQVYRYENHILLVAYHFAKYFSQRSNIYHFVFVYVFTEIYRSF